MSFNSTQNQTNLGRTGSVSSIALGAIHAQRAGNRTESPKLKPPPPKLPTPPPPRDDATKFSALGVGGPSDWEHFGVGEEIDDEEMFGAKKEAKDEPAQGTSVELPAQVPSPVSAPSEVSSPPNQPVGMLRQGHDEYQPMSEQSGIGTPPLQRPMSKPPQQGFVMGDAPPPSHQPQQGFVIGGVGTIPPTSTQSPHSSQYVQPPPAQASYVMGDGGWEPPKQGTPIQQQTQHQVPPTTQQSYVMGNEAWGAQPASSQQPQYAPTNNTFVAHDGGQGPSQQNYNHGSSAWGQQPNEAHIAELKAKDDIYERLKLETETEKSNLRREIDELKVVIDTVKRHAESERNAMEEQAKNSREAAEQAKYNAESERKVLEEQIATMKTTAEQAETNTIALIKEKDAAAERWKEDAEGKDENVKVKEALIADLGKQLKVKDDTIEDLQRQLDAEKSKEPPKPTPSDLIPDIDPWYAGSLERYIAMLRGEAHESLVEDKIKTFTAFLKAESGIRGLEYYNTLPAAPEPAQQPPQQSIDIPRKMSNASLKNKDLNVHVPDQAQPPEDDFQYSPGGRPMMRRQATIPSTETVPPNQSFNFSGGPSSHSTTILTPTSSQDDDFAKTPTPMQSPPEEPPQPQYKAYVPPGITQEQSTEMLRRQSMSFGSATPVSALQTPGSGHNNDEIFFGTRASQTSSNPAGGPATSAATEIPIPSPLFTSKAPKATTPTPVSKKDPVEALKDILPIKIAASQPNPHLEKVRQKLSDVSTDFSFIQDLNTTWERSAALSRKKNDDARRKRQEESESHTDQLFNDHEISYADIGDIEDEFKEKERELKAQEDKTEYESYGTDVFAKVYERLQEQIGTLTDIYIDAESLLQTSVSGIKSLEGSDTATTQESLRLLQQIHEQIEVRHEKVVTVVAERDKKYKKTEVAPLYAAGNITKMKAVEKHFENAERQAVSRAKNEKVEREGEFVHVVEEVVVGAVGSEKNEIERILVAMKDTTDDKSDDEVLKRAHETLKALRESSKSLLSIYNTIEIALNAADGEAEIAHAKAENATPEEIAQLEKGVQDREKGVQEEFERRIRVIDEDEKESEVLVSKKEKGKGKTKENDKEKENEEPPVAKAVLSEEEQKKIRLQKALEAAKRRNGDL